MSQLLSPDEVVTLVKFIGRDRLHTITSYPQFIDCVDKAFPSERPLRVLEMTSEHWGHFNQMRYIIDGVPLPNGNVKPLERVRAYTSAMVATGVALFMLIVIAFIIYCIVT